MIKNSSALNYNSQVLEKLNHICFPLFKSSCIKSFRYFRVFESGHFLNLSTNHLWLSERIENIPDNGESFHKPLCSASAIQDTFFLWDHNSEDTVMSLFLKHNIANGVSVYKRKNNSVEAWSFGATKEDTQAHNFYINNLHILKNFISYFNEVATDLIDDSENSKLAYFGAPISITVLKNGMPSFPAFDRAIALQNQEKLTKSKLSKRELECLSFLSMGKSIKEIANTLQLSSRTVEAYNNNIKRKLNLYRKSDLVKYFWSIFE